jgi:hypothetical protein
MIEKHHPERNQRNCDRQIVTQKSLATTAILQTVAASQLPVLLAGKLFLPGLPVPTGPAISASLILLAMGLCWLAAGPWSSLAFAKRSCAFVLAVVVLLAYPAFAAAIGLQPFSVPDTRLAAAYLVATPFAVGLALFAWRSDEGALSLITSAIVALGTLTLWLGGWAAYASGGPVWQEAGEKISQPVDLGQPFAGDPDIWHIVLDAFGSQAVLSREFGIERESFSILNGVGLEMAPNAVTNYAYTYQSVASMLNMNYLDAMQAPLLAVEDRRPLVGLVQNSSVIRSLSSRGYEIVVAGTGFDTTRETAPSWSRCINCGPTMPGLFETALLSISPFRAFGLWDPIFDAHRARIVDTVGQLAALPQSGSRPRFVFAHLLIPHPPFLLGPGGPLANPQRAFEILDEALYRGSKEEYRAGYAAQARYALNRVGAMVAHARASTRRPLVVIVNGDHGPGLYFDPGRPTEAGTQERLTILLATSFPDGKPHPELRSPVNIYRVVFNSSFRTRLPLLADRSLIPESHRPYVSHDMTERLASILKTDSR